MDSRQEQAFWDAINALDELKILEHVIIVGSWAEYFYPQFFETDFIPNIRTRDVDFFYRNINIPREKVPLITKLEKMDLFMKLTTILVFRNFIERIC